MTRNFTLVLIFLLSSITYGQQDRYRFQIGAGYHTVMQWGFRDFNNVSSPIENQYGLYKDAKWDIGYDNLRFSHGFSFEFGWDYINNEKCILRQTIGVFSNAANESVNFELVDVGNGEVNVQDSSLATQVPVGFTNSSYQDDYWRNGGLNSDLVFLFRLEYFNLGIGLNAYYRNASEYFWTQEGYSPWGLPRQSQAYQTFKGGLTFQIEKEFGRFNAFMKLSQSIFTLKSKKNKGAKYFDGDTQIYPVSHNFDFRHPLIINLGFSLAFDKI